jgi:hypothetical protein
MSYEAERLSIETKLDDNWMTTPIAYENVSFNPPSNSPWIRLFIINGDSGYNTLNSFRYVGVVTIQVFTPQNGGTNTARKYADTISAIFRGKEFDGLIFRASTVKSVGISDGWYQVNVTIPFWRDE